MVLATSIKCVHMMRVYVYIYMCVCAHIYIYIYICLKFGRPRVDSGHS